MILKKLGEFLKSKFEKRIEKKFVENKGKNSSCHFKRSCNGGFGGKSRFLGDYNTLKVIPKSQRENFNCNKQGVLI